jgi:acetyl esterase/lipase
MLHGGGYRLGRPENDTRFAERLADRCGIEVVLPAYRLAPENPFPAGFNDGWKALVALRARIGDAPLLVGGDSAGGGLAAALAVYAAAQGAPRIDGALLFSPWVDMTISAASFTENAQSDMLFPQASAQMASDTYMQGFDLKHPLASPLFADLAGFPPAWINVGNGESLRDDSLSLHAKLTAAGVRSELLGIDGMEHVAPVRGEDLVGSAESFASVAAFVDSLIG